MRPSLVAFAMLASSCREGSVPPPTSEPEPEPEPEQACEESVLVRPLRITDLDMILPESLDNVIVEAILESEVEDGRLDWVVDLREQGGLDCTFRTGDADPVEGEPCVHRFREQEPEATGIASCRETSLRIPEEGTIASVDVDVSSSPPFAFPLREVVLGVGETGVGWIVARITAEDARATLLTDLGTSLCGLMSGDRGLIVDYDDDCENVLACHAGAEPPDRSWTCGDGDPPDTQVGGLAAWTVTALFTPTTIDPMP